jgi:hypothetical protein
MQGVEICLERPWRRETMHNLVKEATAIDFNDLGDDLEVAKDVTLRTLGSGLEGKDKSAIAACPSVGHLVNEVNMLLVSSFDYIRNLFFSAIFQLNASSVFRLFLASSVFRLFKMLYCSKCLVSFDMGIIIIFYFTRYLLHILKIII